MDYSKLYNPLATWLLRSPLHRLLSASCMLATVTGRKSGKRYTFPVNHLREGDVFLSSAMTTAPGGGIYALTAR